ncbi:24776_t:CDS:2, partial [Dentiscutata erythropus]
LSPNTLARWAKEVAEISMQDNLPQFLNRFSLYGILVDKNTRGEKKYNFNLDRCSVSIVLLSVGEAINKNLLNPSQC